MNAGDKRSGSALVLAIGCFFFLFVLVLSVYSVGESIRRKVELQNACDAAAYSAAVVQADALSRMAVVNRAMAWNYIQLTKVQMDYIVFHFLRGVRDRFRQDMQCVEPTGWRFDAKAGYWHLENSLGWVSIPISVRWTGIKYLRFACHLSGSSSHANANNPKARFIGFGEQTEKNKFAIRLGYDDNNIVYFDVSDNDLHAEKGDGKGLLATMRGDATEDEYEKRLLDQIDKFKGILVHLNTALPNIERLLDKAVQTTVRRTLRENLPKKPDGTVDESLLDDYLWTCHNSLSGPPAEYESAASVAEDADGAEGPEPGESWFSGLKNREEDETLFVNMADGMPENASGNVVLADYFADEANRTLAGDGNPPLASGLDQWFIRTKYEDLENSDDVGFSCGTPFLSGGGIMRGYKNANFDEGAVSAWMGKEVHRGNHVFRFGGDSFNPADSLGFLRFDFGSFLGGRAAGEIVNQIAAYIDPVSAVVDAVKAELMKFANNLVDVDPSCQNNRSRFPDTCRNVNTTVGLVAEWEWATAQWYCFYITKRTWNPYSRSRSACFHLPVPAGAFFGGARTDHSYGSGLLSWVGPQLENFTSGGHSRREYRSTFINFNGDRFSWPCNPNTILKGYCRMYGDDMELLQTAAGKRVGFNEGYIGTPAQPWLLNERFFNGGGTVLVALARRRRNVFERFIPSPDAPGLFSAFSPLDALSDSGSGAKWAELARAAKPRYDIAVSAGRAAPAPRAGGGRASGGDTANAARMFGENAGWTKPPLHNVVFDEAAWRNLGPDGHPELPDGRYDGGWSKETLEKDLRFRLGCVCGEESTTRRLDRQWNLSQTDWDGRLVPVRHAVAFCGNADTGAALPKTDSEWENAAVPAPEGEIRNTDGVVAMLAGFNWRKIDEEPEEDGDTGGVPASDVLPSDDGDSPAAWSELFRKRKIL